MLLHFDGFQQGFQSITCFSFRIDYARSSLSYKVYFLVLPDWGIRCQTGNLEYRPHPFKKNANWAILEATRNVSQNLNLIKFHLILFLRRFQKFIQRPYCDVGLDRLFLSNFLNLLLNSGISIFCWSSDEVNSSLLFETKSNSTFFFCKLIKFKFNSQRKKIHEKEESVDIQLQGTSQVPNHWQVTCMLFGG